MSGLVSIIVPCFNEEQVLRATNRNLIAALENLPYEYEFEVIYVDDGSSDSSFEVLRELQALDSRIRVLRFSRNFGHQIAITAGLKHASGDAAVIIDADLQDPPEVIADFVECWRNGSSMVFAPSAMAKRPSSSGLRKFSTAR